MPRSLRKADPLSKRRSLGDPHPSCAPRPRAALAPNGPSPSCPAPWRRHRHPRPATGSVLLLTVILLALLSALLLSVTDSVLLGTKARRSMQVALETLYIAEAGLAHGRALCEAGKAPVDDSPLDWRPFGRGEYRLEGFRLDRDSQPFIDRETGLLLVAYARLGEEGNKRVCLLLEEPPSCRPIAWWEPN